MTDRLTRYHPALRVGTRLLLSMTVLGVLLWQVRGIGWAAVLTALPTSPWFYLLGLVLYLALPVSETLIFHRLWGTGWTTLPVLLRKRVYNEAILDYSGEALLYRWANRHLGLGHRASLSNVKDSALLSGLASNGATVLLLVLLTTSSGLPALAGQANLLWMAVGLAILLSAGVVLLRGRLLGVDTTLALYMVGIHAGRVAVVSVVQALQWWVAMPAASPGVWLGFLTLRMVVTRIPFLPGRDLAFAGAGIAAGGLMDVAQADIAAVLATAGALTLALHIVTYVATHQTVPAKTPTEPAPEND